MTNLAVAHPLPGFASGAISESWLTQSDSLHALDEYITTTPLKTEEARKVRDEWILWFGGTSAYDRNFDQKTYDDARRLRNRFSLANATTAEEREAVARVLREGLTDEELAGEQRRMTSKGEFPKVPSLVPSLPSFGQLTDFMKALGFMALGIGAFILIARSRK